MKQLLWLALSIFVLSISSSCSEDIAEDGTKRGKLFYVGNVVKNGKEYTVFVYNRSETIESADQSSATFWYWITYTVDTRTGKAVHQTTFDVDENSGNFMGISDHYAFFSRPDGVSAIDLHKNNKVIDPESLKKLICKSTPPLKGKIAYLETDGYGNLRTITKSGDIYLLNTKSLKGKLITDGLDLDPEYVLKNTLPDYGNSVLINGRIHGYVISDTTTLALEAFDPTNVHKCFLYKLSHPSRENIPEMVKNITYDKSDSTIFLDASMKGFSDSVITVEYLSALGSTGVKMLGAYSLKKRSFIWSKPVYSLYDHTNDDSYYTFFWNADGNSFFIYSQENEYTPVSLVNAKTGKIIWKF